MSQDFFVAAAYIVAAIIFLGLTAISWLDFRRQKRRLATRLRESGELEP